MEYSLEIQGLSKKFLHILHKKSLYRFVRKVFAGEMNYKEIWALRDINFALAKGEHMGIIGGNGAGKTTLLRIIAGIYRHTTGSVNINGSIAGFFQFEIGMDRDLMVLDNIYLFGAIMGLNRSEINEKLKDILDFSDLNDWLYFPLSEISAGAIQRLAIAIAKEANPKIMFLDEMLSGGDFIFQEKCVEVFRKFKKNGQSLIASSHDLNLIDRVCDKVLLLEKGRQISFGPTKEILSLYWKDSV